MSQAQINTDAPVNDSPRYFDLHTSGVGYLSRVREVKVKKGEPFICVDVSALRGTSDAVEYTRFDCRISGEEAISVINRLRPDIEAKKKVLVGFKVGDLYAEAFVYEKGDKAGQTGISLKAHLLRLTFAKVDGVMVYQPPRDTAALPKAA